MRVKFKKRVENGNQALYYKHEWFIAPCATV